MEIVILSRSWFEDRQRFPIKATDMIISVVTPGFSYPRLFDPQLIGVPRLTLEFYDVMRFEESGDQIFAPISEEQATKIVDFVLDYFTRSDRMVIHCDAGESRSPGVAIGLARYFEFSSENRLRDLYPRFNLTVAKTIWKDCQKRSMSEITI
jgi:predicted protein tyrosine phosphatase